MATILLQFHGVPGEGDGLIFDFERAVIHPYGNFLIGQTPFAIQLPVVEARGAPCWFKCRV
jgi:hypothetical protein